MNNYVNSMPEIASMNGKGYIYDSCWAIVSISNIEHNVTKIEHNVTRFSQL